MEFQISLDLTGIFLLLTYTPVEDDSVIDQNGIKMIVDSYSQKYLKGTNIDYIESLMGSGFKINNPNVTKSCSCGHSFSTE